jgi:peptidyl-dipeptidase A
MDASLPWLLRTPSHILTTEAIAIFMGGLSSGEAWLKEYVGVEPSEAAAVAAEARREDRAQKLIFTRWVLVMTAFERGMYENPDRDLNSFWWDSVTKFQQVRKPEGRNGPDWATKLHVALAPAYYHNYLLGDMYACQLRHHILTNVLDGGDMHDLVTSKRLGEFLRDGLFAMGASHEWKETIERTTGEPLNPAYFVKECQE